MRNGVVHRFVQLILCVSRVSADPNASEEQVEQYLQAGESRIFADMLFHNSAAAHTIKTTYEMVLSRAFSPPFDCFSHMIMAFLVCAGCGKVP